MLAHSFIFDQLIIKVASNQDRHKSLVEFDFGPNQITHFFNHLNLNISEASWPILIKFYVYYHWGGGKAA